MVGDSITATQAQLRPVWIVITGAVVVWRVPTRSSRYCAPGFAAGAGRRPRRSSVRHRLGLPCGRSEYDPDRRHCAQRQHLGPITHRDSRTSEPRIRGADYALRVDGEFVAAGRRGTAGSGVSPSLVFSCPGRIACGAPVGAQFRGLGRERPCRWSCRAVGGRASGVGGAAGPRSVSQPGRGTGPGSRRRQRQPDGAHGASEASPASEPFRLVEPQQV